MNKGIMTNETPMLLELRNNSRFKERPETHGRHFYFLDKNDDPIGLVWFKYTLGGWRLQLNSDKNGEWVERGVINSPEHLLILCGLK